MSPEPLPLAAAQARLGRPGRPRAQSQGTVPARTGPSTAQPRDSAKPDRGSAPDHETSALPGRLLDVYDAARYLSVSSWSIRDLCAAGRLPRVRLPLAGDREKRRLLFDLRDLDTLIERSKDRTQ
jgi:Helix-turn-helix domain